jgi:hypothetical protein
VGGPRVRNIDEDYRPNGGQVGGMVVNRNKIDVRVGVNCMREMSNKYDRDVEYLRNAVSDRILAAGKKIIHRFGNRLCECECE